MKFLSKFFLAVLLLTVFSVTTEAPTVASDFDLVVGIEVGESLTINDIDWFALVNSDSFDLSGPFLTEGDGSACVLGGEFGYKVVGKAPGTCLLEARLNVDPFEPSPNWEVADFRINVTIPPPTTIPSPTTFLPPVDFEWTEARVANKDYFDLVQAIETWNLGYTGEGSVVAIIDGGFDVTHPDFTDRII